MGHKGYYGEYTGNAKWSKDHAHTRVTKENYKATERDDAAHIDYLKRDINYDAKHGHSDEKMTADEKHISKLAGDMKYDKEHHSPVKNKVEGMTHEELAKFSQNRPMPASGKTGYERHMEMHNSAAKHINKFMDENHQHNKNHDERPMHSHKNYEPKKSKKAVNMEGPLKYHKIGHDKDFSDMGYEVDPLGNILKMPMPMGEKKLLNPPIPKEYTVEELPKEAAQEGLQELQTGLQRPVGKGMTEKQHQMYRDLANEAAKAAFIGALGRGGKGLTRNAPPRPLGFQMKKYR